MKYYTLILFTTFLFCKNKDATPMEKNIELVPLSPYTYTFETNGKKNKIDYYIIRNPPSETKQLYNKLRNEINSRYQTKEDYNYLSIYIYKETNQLNEHYNGNKESFDGKNNDLVAFIRFIKNKTDIFYIIKDSKVIYDGVEDQAMNFEFDE